MSSSKIICYALLVSLSLGCSKKEDEKKTSAEKPVVAAQNVAPKSMTPTADIQHPTIPTPPTAVKHPEITVASGTPSTNMPHSGKVLATKPAGSYVYVQVEAEGSQLWLATNQLETNVGDIVHWDQYSVMQNFYSKTLKETFPTVLFVSALLPGPAPAAPEPSKGKVHTLLQSGGYTYIQVNDANGLWLAVPTTQLKEGDTVVWGQGSVMKNFASKTLERTFPEILFLSKVTVE